MPISIRVRHPSQSTQAVQNLKTPFAQQFAPPLIFPPPTPQSTHRFVMPHVRLTMHLRRVKQFCPRLLIRLNREWGLRLPWILPYFPAKILRVTKVAIRFPAKINPVVMLSISLPAKILRVTRYPVQFQIIHVDKNRCSSHPQVDPELTNIQNSQQKPVVRWREKRSLPPFAGI